MPRPALDPDQSRIFVAGFLRSVAVGLSGVLLAIHLHALGWDVRWVGILVSVGLAGAALATLLASFFADAFGRRRALVLLTLLYALGGVVLIFSSVLADRAALFLAAAFFGMINGLGRDRGPSYALEQALLPETTTAERRTWVIAWYSLLLDIGLALGSLTAGLPFLLRRLWHIETLASYQAAWVLYTLLVVATISVYLRLAPRVEVAESSRLNFSAPSREGKSTVFKLASLTGMDSLGGGFLSSALVSYWFFQRFGLGEESLGLVFFAARIANAGSHLAAAWLARRIGLLNTMVFTHIPSSLFLIAVPFAPDLFWAVVFFLLRESLVEMDVPTRQSYILAVVRPEERAFASGMTTFTRNVAYATAPAFAGWAMRGLSMASPLFFGGGIKIAYDILLYFSFRRVKPPEER